MIQSPILNPAYAGTSEAPYETCEWFAVNSGGNDETKFRPIHLYLENLIHRRRPQCWFPSNRPEHGRGLNGSRNFNPAYAGTASSGVRTGSAS